MILEPIQDLLAAQGVGVVGQDLFVGDMPAHVQRGVLLLQDLSGTLINAEMPGLRHGGFQVIVRNPDYLAGMQLAWRVIEVLAFEQRRSLSGYWFRYVRARHEPVPYPTSNGLNREFSVNYDACYDV